MINQNSINWALRGRFKIDGDGIIFWPNFHDNTFLKNLLNVLDGVQGWRKCSKSLRRFMQDRKMITDIEIFVSSSLFTER